jgi:hypothetical protein
VTHRLAVLLLTLALAALACNTVAPPRPDLEWDPASDALIIEAYFAGGLVPQNMALNALPAARVYGDGRIVWVEVTRGLRTVYEGTLTREQMTALLTRISDAGFFGWKSLYGPVNEVMDAGTTVLAVNLTSGRTQVAEYFEGAPPKFHELVGWLSGGAGATGVTYSPPRGYLTALPVGDNSQPPAYRWSEADAGFALAEAVEGRYIEGPALAQAWDIVNTDQFARVESGGEQYYLVVQVPGLSLVEPPP